MTFLEWFIPMLIVAVAFAIFYVIDSYNRSEWTSDIVYKDILLLVFFIFTPCINAIIAFCAIIALLLVILNFIFEGIEKIWNSDILNKPIFSKHDKD